MRRAFYTVDKAIKATPLPGNRWCIDVLRNGEYLFVCYMKSDLQVEYKEPPPVTGDEAARILWVLGRCRILDMLSNYDNSKNKSHDS